MFEFVKRIASFFRRDRLEQDLEDEIRFHLAMLEDEQREQGLDGPAARAAARREFGGVDQMKEVYRERRGLPWLEILLKDVRHAVRGLGRSPAFTVAVVVSLALGIGANTAIFSLLNALMLRMLPVERPAELVSLYKTGGWGEGVTSYPLYTQFRDRADLFRGVLASHGPSEVRFSTGAGAGNLASREFVSGNYFQVLGVRPALGRLLTEEDDHLPHGEPVAVLSYDLWRNRFGLDPHVIGKLITVGHQGFTVVGVAQPSFHGVSVEDHSDLWIPLTQRRFDFTKPGMHWLRMIARRRANMTMAQIQTAVNTVFAQYLQDNYGRDSDLAFRKTAMEQRIDVRDGGVGLSLLRKEFGTPLKFLMILVGVVLFAACVNVANLLLARSAAREREIAVRLSIGATRYRLIRQSMLESLILVILGSSLGLGFATWGIRFLLLFLPQGLAPALDASPDRAVLTFTALISLVSAAVFGIVPALRACAVDPGLALKGGEPQIRSHGIGFSLRQSLVVAQVALSVILVFLASLLAHSLAQLRAIDLGIRYQDVITFSLDEPGDFNRAGREQLRDRLLARIRSLPGVVSASNGSPGPYEQGTSSGSVQVPDSTRMTNEPVEVAIHHVGGDYFTTIGSAPLLGRDFDQRDLAASRRVAIVNETFVRAFLPGLDPIGRVLRCDDEAPQGGEPAYIVGVVRDILHQGLRSKPEPTVYVPATQSTSPFAGVLLVRAQLPADSLIPVIRREMRRMAPEMIMNEPRTVGQVVDSSIYLDRMTATVSGFFGVLALMLSALGVYGVLAYNVTARTREIGIRMALGATGGGVTWAVLRSGATVIATGIALGLPLALATGRVTSSLLYGIRPSDPLALTSAAVVLAITGIAAAWIPAHRAASVHPLDALRHE